MNRKIEIRCRNGHCTRLFMNYYVTGNNVDLNLGGFELSTGLYVSPGCDEELVKKLRFD